MGGVCLVVILHSRVRILLGESLEPGSRRWDGPGFCALQLVSERLSLLHANGLLHERLVVFPNRLRDKGRGLVAAS